jgi:hypothetical protein
MLKVYALTVQHSSLSSVSNGRYFIITDGRYVAAYNEQRYTTTLFGEKPVLLFDGDSVSPTEAITTISKWAENVIANKLCTYMLSFEARQAAKEMADDIRSESFAWAMSVDSHAMDRVVRMLYSRLTSGNYIRDQRVDNIVNGVMRRERKAAGMDVVTPTPAAHYKGHSYTQRAYRAIRNARRNLSKFIKDSITAQDFDTSDLVNLLNPMHRISSNFVTRVALERYEELGFDEIVRCDCGHLEVYEDTQTVRNDTWCSVCFEEDAVYVEDLGEYWSRDDAYYHEGDSLYYSYDEDRSYDDEDEDDDEPQGLMSYSTNVLRVLAPDSSIQSSKFGNFTMGVELEMCAGSRSSIDDAVEDVRARLGEDYVVCKSDGSLPSDGFEVVTAPRGLDEHIRRFKAWDVKPTYRAWNAKQCGLHVHIDSRAFTQMTLGKFLIFINDDNNADFIRSLAGRHPKMDDQARNYCAAENQSVITDPLKAIKGKDASRYRMVNVTNMDRDELIRLGINWRQYDTSGRKFNTVELRIFRASLKKERLLAQIEFAHAAVMFVRAASYRDLTEGAFKGWLAKSHVLYPHLAAWFDVAPKKKANPNVAAVVATDETVA